MGGLKFDKIELSALQICSKLKYWHGSFDVLYSFLNCNIFFEILIFTILDFGHCIQELRDNNFSAYQITTPWIYVPLPKTCTILVRHVPTLQNSLLNKHSIAYRAILWTLSSMSWTEGI